MWAVASVPVLVALTLSDARGDHGTGLEPAVVTAQLAMLAAAVGLACHFHRTRSARSAWTSAALTVAPVAVGMVAIAAALDGHGPSGGGAVVLCLGVSGVTLAWLVAPDCVAEAPHHPVTTGSVAGAVAAVASVGASVATPGPARAAPPLAIGAVATCFVVLGVLAARSIAHHDGLPSSTRALLVAGGALSATATASSMLLDPTGVAHVATSVAQVAGWAALIAVAARVLALLADLRATDYERVAQRVRFRELDLRHAETRLHEARSAVAGIASAHRIISSGTPLASESRRRLESMNDAEIARLQRLLSADRAGVEPLPAGLLEDTLEPVVESLRARGHAVALLTSRPHHHGEPDEVACIVHALLDNAACHGRGPIELTVEDRAEAVLISVTDHGPGVPRDLRDHIFDWGASSTGSSGIGLYDAHSRARSLGGRLRLDEALPGSTRFELELPFDGARLS